MTARIFMLINLCFVLLLVLVLFFYYCVAAYHKFPCNPVLMHSINYYGFSQSHHALQIVNFEWISVVCPNTIACVV